MANGEWRMAGYHFLAHDSLLGHDALLTLTIRYSRVNAAPHRWRIPMTKRIAREQCCGIIVDVQEFFLQQVPKRLRSRVETNTRNFGALLGYFQVPIVVTIERPVDQKGSLPRKIAQGLADTAATFEKDFFDLTREKTIRDHLRRLKKKQAIVAGCETDALSPQTS